MPYNKENNYKSKLEYGPSLLMLFSEPYDNLRVLGRRSILALLGITIGCMSIISLLNIGHNARIQALSVFKEMGSDLIVCNIRNRQGFSSSTTKENSTFDTRDLQTK